MDVENRFLETFHSNDSTFPRSIAFVFLLDFSNYFTRFMDCTDHVR